MVERVARGRILVSAAAALGAVSAGLMAPGPAAAADRSATLQIRVQVVEPCQIRVLPGGTLRQACGGGGRSQPPLVSIGDLADHLAARLPQPPAPIAAPSAPKLAPLPMPPGLHMPDRSPGANQRALGVAAGIAERVRFITLTY